MNFLSLNVWTPRSLFLLVQHCNRLRTLDISRCKNISVTTVDLLQSQLPFLENIHYRFIGGVDLTLAFWLIQCPKWPLDLFSDKTCWPKHALRVELLHIFSHLHYLFCKVVSHLHVIRYCKWFLKSLFVMEQVQLLWNDCGNGSVCGANNFICIACIQTIKLRHSTVMLCMNGTFMFNLCGASSLRTKISCK